MHLAEMASARAGARTTEGRHDRPTGRARRVDATTVAATSVVVVTLGAGVVVGSVPVAAWAAIGLLVPAAVIDARTRRLPDPWVAAAAFAFALAWALGLAAGWTNGPGATEVATGIALTAGPLAALHLVAPASMGFGDVKAAAVLGAAAATVDARSGLVVLALASAAAASTALVRRRRTIAFGPFLVAAGWVVVLAGGAT
jgi:leader peptidase (prepilin peptidase)/N-methyltransferase